MNLVTIDFETKKIEDKPNYPPEPVGVAIKYGDEPSRYYSWGHPTGNNSTFEEGRLALAHALMAGEPLYHNAKFDLDVARKHMALPIPVGFHDSMLALFLHDPNQPDLHLKSAAHRLLGIPPTERDEVEEWLLRNQPIPGVRIGNGKSSKHPWGAYISEAPADLVGRYACGDVDRTKAIYDKLSPTLPREAYHRELDLLKVLLKIEPMGVRIDVERLDRDCKAYLGFVSMVEDYLRGVLRVGPSMNFDSGAELISALSSSGYLDRGRLKRTRTGRESNSKDSFQEAVTDPAILGLLRWRRETLTCLRTFMLPWLSTASFSGGRIFTTWYQTRGMDGGTRTGRMSSHPNFQNIPNVFKPIWAHEQDGLPVCPIVGLPSLPNMRSYILPYEEGHILICRDYSQQELRILAHFEDAKMLDAYLKDAWVDFHDMAQGLIHASTGILYPRKFIKTMVFGLIYGMGVARLAGELGIRFDEAQCLREAFLEVFPGIKTLNSDLKSFGMNNRKIFTWGGRPYLVEPPRQTEWGLKTYEYKLLNTLIQGSAADCTKEATNRYDRDKPSYHHLLLTVHDEFLSSVPEEEVEIGMEVLRHSMESVKFDLPMLSEGKVGYNWSDMRPYDKRGVRCDK